ncbi:uncharacterized protein J3D65DRAFT_444332 [Phyllosticta citribraziliensis]|uniref:Secreted protein n=1 Tax=Phyllosticta citribraziliensis TaxID=989973 RepID=A0ABR1LJ23_9PEZI
MRLLPFVVTGSVRAIIERVEAACAMACVFGFQLHRWRLLAVKGGHEFGQWKKKEVTRVCKETRRNRNIGRGLVLITKLHIHQTLRACMHAVWRWYSPQCFCARKDIQRGRTRKKNKPRAHHVEQRTREKSASNTGVGNANNATDAFHAQIEDRVRKASIPNTAPP